MSPATHPVICLAHGSRHPRADATVADIARTVAELTGRESGEVKAAYLDFSPLTLTTVARLLAAEGHREAVVVPLLFTSAFHMNEDVPEAMEEATAETGVVLHLAGCIGTDTDLAELLAARIAERVSGQSPAPEHLVLYSVGSSVAGANDHVADLATEVAERLGVTGQARVATGGEGTGAAALVADIERTVDAGAAGVIVEPLFISPGRLWDMAVDAVAASPVADRVTVGEPLTTSIGPVVAARADAVGVAEAR